MMTAARNGAFMADDTKDVERLAPADRPGYDPNDYLGTPGNQDVQGAPKNADERKKMEGTALKARDKQETQTEQSLTQGPVAASAPSEQGDSGDSKKADKKKGK